MVPIVIEVPADFKALATALKDVVQEVVSQRRGLGRGGSVAYGNIEAAIADAVGKIERASHQTLLEALDVDHPQVVIGGKVFTRVGRGEAPYYTMAGAVPVERSLYRENGVRNAKVVNPVTLRAGAVAGSWLPRTAQAMARRLQQGTSREAEATSHAEHRLPYSRSSFEDVGHAVGQIYVSTHAEVERVLIEELEIPDKAASVSVSVDRVSIPMEEPCTRPVGRPRKDAPKRPIERNYRMGYCGTVTLHDAKGEALHTIRYGRMPQGDAAGLAEGLADDVLALLIQRPDLQVVKLLDGAAELWSLLDEHLTDEDVGSPCHRLLDKWHVLEKLDAAAKVIHGEEGSKAIRRRWRMRLRNSVKGAKTILAELQDSGKEWVRLGDRAPVHDAITYLQNHEDRLDYATARREGLPVGSGNVEATCKSLVAIRMKRAGSRWKERTGEHVIQLRALALSDRWERAMQLSLAPLSRSVRRAA